MNPDSEETGEIYEHVDVGKVDEDLKDQIPDHNK